MARETLGELYARIGLDFDDLERNFVQVDRTLNENMSRLNRQSNIIDLQARVDLTGLDAAADATRIFEIRQRALQQQIETQRARVSVLNNVLADARERTGDLSDETQRAQLSYERARLSLARLEQSLQDLNQTQGQTHEGFKDFFKTITEQAMVMSSREILGGIVEVLSQAATASAELVNRFKELETQAYELNLPFEKTRDLLRQIRLAGGDIGDYEGFVRGISDAMVKGEIDDPEALVFAKYGESAFDAQGHIKSFDEMTAAIVRMYDKAKAAGEEIEFLQMLGGESGVRDAIQMLERWKEAQEDTDKIFKSSLNAEEMHKAERAVGLLTEQFGELKDEIVNLTTPATIETANEFFEIFRDATKFIKENREEIKLFGEGFFAHLGNPFATLADVQTILKRTQPAIKNVADAIQDANAKLLNLRGTKDAQSDDTVLSQYGLQRIKQFQDEIEDLKLELDYEDEIERKLAEIELWRQRELTDKLYVTNEERLKIEELYALKIEQVKQEQAAEIEKIEKESAARTKQLMQETADIQFEASHSAYEKEIQDIQNWAKESLRALDEYKSAVQDKNVVIQEAIAITQNALEKEARAFEREMDRIKGANQSLMEKIFEQEHSRRDVDIMRAQKERAQLYEEGIYSAEMIERYYQNRLGEIRQAAYDNANYTKKPKRIMQDTSEIPVYYGDNLANANKMRANLPDTDFYGKIQSQVEKEISRADHPVQQLREQYIESMQELSHSFQRSTEDLAQAAQSLKDITQQAAALIAPPQQKQTAINITVAPNIDLGGAYVFDDEMKDKLADDITNEVVIAVKDAFQSATHASDYSFGN